MKGFGHYNYNPDLKSNFVLMDWPQLWATVVLDEALDQTPHLTVWMSRAEAREGARKLVVDLLRDQEKRRASFQNMVATARQRVLGKRLVAEDFEKAIRYEHVLYGPLTQAGMDAFQLTRAESAHGIVQFQRDLGTGTLPKAFISLWGYGRWVGLRLYKANQG